MILLFDQNISFKVPKGIQTFFPGAKHLSDLRLETYKDMEIWEFAKANNYCIVTYNFDFIDNSALKGFPPKVILLRIGNASVEKIIDRIQNDTELISDFLKSVDTAFLELK